MPANCRLTSTKLLKYFSNYKFSYKSSLICKLMYISPWSLLLAITRPSAPGKLSTNRKVPFSTTRPVAIPASIQGLWFTAALDGERTPFPCKSRFIILDLIFLHDYISLIFRSILKFINWQAQAIKEVNGANLVTIGSWSEHAQTNAFSDSSIKLINHFIALLLFSYDFFLQGN